MFLTKRQIIMRRIKSVVTALAIVVLYAAMVSAVVLILKTI